MKTKINAVWNKDHYYHFGIHPDFTSIYGDDPKDIVIVEVTPSKDQTMGDKQEYWGWWNFEKRKFEMIYPSAVSFKVCFPYGYKVSENAGNGKAYKLDVIEINKNNLL